MTTEERLLELKKMGDGIDTLDENEAIVQIITVKGRFYPLINGDYTAIQALMEAAYRLFPDFKDIIDDIVNGESVIKELKTDHLNK
ncbi:MAG TPA: hypothetical protein DEG28_00980 [Porphyromonadaceae bacterium]|nr:hypothetical protein [Porphyromonadaceae bacterium]